MLFMTFKKDGGKDGILVVYSEIHFNEDRFITKFFPERIHIFHIKNSSLRRTFRLTKQNRGTNVYVKMNSLCSMSKTTYEQSIHTA